jgi:hypothetical protein
MRSGLIAALMGIGGILASFGATILVISIFSRMNDWRVQLPEMLSVGTGAVLVGGVMFLAGFLLDRVGRDRSREGVDRSRDGATA